MLVTRLSRLILIGDLNQTKMLLALDFSHFGFQQPNGPAMRRARHSADSAVHPIR